MVATPDEHTHDDEHTRKSQYSSASNKRKSFVISATEKQTEKKISFAFESSIPSTNSLVWVFSLLFFHSICAAILVDSICRTTLLIDTQYFFFSQQIALHEKFQLFSSQQNSFMTLECHTHRIRSTDSANSSTIQKKRRRRRMHCAFLWIFNMAQVSRDHMIDCRWTSLITLISIQLKRTDILSSAQLSSIAPSNLERFFCLSILVCLSACQAIGNNITCSSRLLCQNIGFSSSHFCKSSFSLSRYTVNELRMFIFYSCNYWILAFITGAKWLFHFDSHAIVLMRMQQHSRVNE